MIENNAEFQLLLDEKSSRSLIHSSVKTAAATAAKEQGVGIGKTTAKILASEIVDYWIYGRMHPCKTTHCTLQ